MGTRHLSLGSEEDCVPLLHRPFSYYHVEATKPYHLPDFRDEIELSYANLTSGLFLLHQHWPLFLAASNASLDSLIYRTVVVTLLNHIVSWHSGEIIILSFKRSTLCSLQS